jgi:amidase
MGPLHGLPISVKEHINMAGLTCNAGFVSWVDRKPTKDAHILQLLYSAGAVFYARTTQPQTLMHLETSSNLYGETVNPFNRQLTAGGSSGGEGALIGMRGSCLGIGTDIGGSIRSPAANCGVYGLRPTSYRLPMQGLSATMLGQEHVVPVIGPLSTSLSGVNVFMKTLLDQKPWLTEPSLVPIPWRDDTEWIPKTPEGKKTLKIAVMWDDGVVKPQPPVQRALKQLASKLASIAEVEVIDWKPYRHDRAWEIISTLYFADGAAEEHAAIRTSGEPYRPLSKWILSHAKPLSVSQVWRWTEARDAYREQYTAVWNETATNKSITEDSEAHELDGMVDVILCPVGPGPAPLLNHAKYWGYTAVWNLLDYPALIFPVTVVDPAVDVVEEGYQPMNEKDRINFAMYEPQIFKEAPVSLQLVGRRYEDEKVVQALEFIESVIGGLPLDKPQ